MATSESQRIVTLTSGRCATFAGTSQYAANDVISLRTSAVTETKIARPSDVDVLANAPRRGLTLVTCYPFYYLGNAPSEIIKRVWRKGERFRADGGKPETIFEHPLKRPYPAPGLVVMDSAN